MELFKQNQYAPIPIEIQAAVLWAMQNNLLDDVPVDKVKDFQAKLTEFLTTRKADLLKKSARESDQRRPRRRAEGGGHRIQAVV